MAIGGTATGTLAPLKCKGGDGAVPPIGTIHWWKVDMVTGKTYRIEVRGASTGDGTAENYRIRAVLDPGVTETGHGYGALAYADYAKNRIARVDFTAMRTGTHHVVVESLGGFNKEIDDDQCDEPDVHDLFGGRPGDKGTYTIAVDALTGLPSQAASATALTLGTRHEGELRRGHGVRNWYRVNLAGAAVYEVTMTQVERNGKWLRFPTIYGVYRPSDEALPRTRSIGGSSHPGRLPVESAPRPGQVQIARGGRVSDFRGRRQRRVCLYWQGSACGDLPLRHRDQGVHVPGRDRNEWRGLPISDYGGIGVLLHDRGRHREGTPRERRRQ